MPAFRPSVRHQQEDKQLLPFPILPPIITEPNLTLQTNLTRALKATAPLANPSFQKPPSELIKPHPQLNLIRRVFQGLRNAKKSIENSIRRTI
jgi:hypothetical protein